MQSTTNIISDKTLICSVPHSLHKSNDTLLCIGLESQATIAITPFEAEILATLDRFKPLGEWVNILGINAVQRRFEKSAWSRLFGERVRSQLLSHLGQGRPSSFARANGSLYKFYRTNIHSLITKHLILCESQAMYLLSKGPDDSLPDRRITTLCIPTCFRTDAFRRCVGSFARNLKEHGRTDARIIAVDDSREGTREAYNSGIVDDVRARYEVDIQYFGMTRRKLLIDNLIARSSVPPEVIRFGLNPDKIATTVGAVRNTMMLLTTGEHILQTDDDTYCGYAPSGEVAGRQTPVSIFR